MNWKAIKNIYYQVLVNNHNIEYLGGNRYKLSCVYNLDGYLDIKEFDNEKLISWSKNGYGLYGGVNLRDVFNKKLP